MVIIMPEPGDEDKLSALDDSKPDAVIEKLSDLLNLFPARPSPAVGA